LSVASGRCVDLIQYEQAKFELAAILRSAGMRLRSEGLNVQGPFSDLFARLADDRFNLMVIGRFSRGKSSLMNALLDTERLPMGIVPITSVITTVSYGSGERAFIEYQGSHLDIELTLDKLPDYITQQGNPGNQRRVTPARIELPFELLRRGFHFIDTPGLGSAITANTLTTERFLPQADALMVVTSFDSTLSEEELRVLRRIAPSANHAFLVINKHDLVSAAERSEVLAHVEQQARRVFGQPVPGIFSVSAREALEAKRNRDSERYAASGVDRLRAEVTRFLLTDRQTHFLLRTCERVFDALKEAGNFRTEGSGSR
jgi:GTP-binding protein EngB required for normal cell division